MPDENMSGKFKILFIASSKCGHSINRIKYFVNPDNEVYLLGDDEYHDSDGITGLTPLNHILSSRFLRIIFNSAQRLKQSWIIKLLHLYSATKIVGIVNPDVIHVHYAGGMLAWAVSVFTKKPVIVSTMGGDIYFDEQKCSNVYQRRETIDILRRADLITVKSEHMGRHLLNMGIDGKRITKVIWGIDFNIFRPKPKQNILNEYISSNKKIIIYPRPFSRFYNVHIAVQAMPEILKCHPEAVLVIPLLGTDEDYRNELDSKIKGLNIMDSVVFIPKIDFSLMPDFYSTAEISLALPPSDGFPQALLEGMACGVPNIISNLEVYKDIIIDGENALMVEIDPLRVAEAVNKLLDNDVLRSSIISKAMETVHRAADIKKEVAKVESYYMNLKASENINYFNDFEKLMISIKIIASFMAYKIKMNR